MGWTNERRRDWRRLHPEQLSAENKRRLPAKLKWKREKMENPLYRAEQNAKESKRQCARYANDPVFRAARKQRSTARYAKKNEARLKLAGFIASVFGRQIHTAIKMRVSRLAAGRRKRWCEKHGGYSLGYYHKNKILPLIRARRQAQRTEDRERILLNLGGQL